MYTLLLIVVTLVISLIITPIIIKVSFKFNLVDRPNYRKVHTKPVSVMGGTVILLSFLIGLWLGHPIERAVKPLVIGLIIMYFVGIIDDIYDLKPILKLIGQIIAASVVVFTDYYRFYFFSNWSNHSFWYFKYTDYNYMDCSNNKCNKFNRWFRWFGIRCVSYWFNYHWFHSYITRKCIYHYDL